MDAKVVMSTCIQWPRTPVVIRGISTGITMALLSATPNDIVVDLRVLYCCAIMTARITRNLSESRAAMAQILDSLYIKNLQCSSVLDAIPLGIVGMGPRRLPQATAHICATEALPSVRSTMGWGCSKTRACQRGVSSATIVTRGTLSLLTSRERQLSVRIRSEKYQCEGRGARRGTHR
jgi:hypothetical protein